MQQWKHSPLPEAVTSVHQLVGPTLEPALAPHLSRGRPEQEVVQVTQPLLAQEYEGGEATE